MAKESESSEKVENYRFRDVWSMELAEKQQTKSVFLIFSPTKTSSAMSEFWPQMKPNLKFDPKVRFFSLEIISGSYWSFWAIVRENSSLLWFKKINLNRKQAIKPEVEFLL